MPAWALRTYVVMQDAGDAGLAFDCPSWWDLERLFELYADRRVMPPPDNQEVLLVSWAHILSFNLRTGEREWDLPELEPIPKEILPRRKEILGMLQDAQWVIIRRDRVWAVPESARKGCYITQGPYWWSLWELPTLYKERFIEEKNSFWLDYVALLTAKEALAWDEQAREQFRVWRQKVSGRGLTSYDRKEMAHFAQVLRKAEWVVLYDYEWESGLD